MGKGKYPPRFAVYAKIGHTKYQKHTWALPKKEAEQFASHLKKANVPNVPVTRITVKKLTQRQIAKDVRAAKNFGSPKNLPASVKRLVTISKRRR